MVDETNDPVGIRLSGRSIRFSGNVSLGNLLIMLGMLAGGGSTIFVLGSSVQHVQDAIVSETEIRTQSVRELASKIDSLAQQETRDIADIKLTMSDVRADLRSLVTINPPPRR